MKVQRYHVLGTVWEAGTGNFVTSSDYDALMRKVERLGKIKNKLSQRLCATREKLCKVALERDGHRERADKLARDIIGSGNLFEHHELAMAALGRKGAK